VETLNKEQIKGVIKEMLKDGTIEILPSYQNHWVKVQIIIDGEIIQENEG
jgi:hypothetical protein